MNVLTRMLRVVMAVAVVALALPAGTAFGAEKQYTLTVSPATPTASTGPFTFTFTNEGNSSFNSLELYAPVGWSIPVGTVVSSSRGTASVNADGKGVTVNAINLPNGAGQSMTVTVDAVTGTATCGAQSGEWTAQPWTGSSVGSGQKFRLSGPRPSTSLPPACYTVTSSANANGSISPLGAQTVGAGSTKSFTITPATGYDIGTTGGTCGGTLVGNTFTTLAVNANCTVIANFTIKTFTVQGSPAANVTPTPQTKNYNQTASFTVTPPPNYHTTSASSDTCGGSLVGTTFTTGPVTANCTVTASFVANALTVVAPDKAYIKTPFDVTVTQDGPPSTVGITSNCGYAVTATSTSGSTTTFTGEIPALPSTGSCLLTVSADGYPSQQKTLSVYTGELGCYPTNWTAGDLIPGELKSYVKASDQGKWGLVRGSNKDSTGCVAVPYIFDLKVDSTPQIASFIVPDPAVTPFQKVSAEYVVVWGRVAVDASGDFSSWTTKRPKLSWGTAVAPVPGTNDYVPALSCVLDPDNPDLIPVPYANGFVSVPTADLDSLLPTIPDVPPFSNLYNATTCPTCIKNNPAYPQYQPGLKAKMCIAQQGWTAVGQDDSSGPTLVQYWTRVIDQADGFMTLD